MNIQLIDFDGKIPNIALMKISAYHKSLKDNVSLVRGTPQTLSQNLFSDINKSYLSCIFRWNQKQASLVKQKIGDTCLVGGTGVDIYSDLPDHIKKAEPDYSIYPECNYSIGFISRGCIRACPWCVVPQKEGALSRVSEAKEVVGKRKSAVFLDNNFLALPDFNKDLEWLSKNRIKIDFNQALDARLVDSNVARLLAKCTWNPCIRLSLDSTGMIEHVKTAVYNLDKAGVNRGLIRVFVLIGFSGFESDVERLIKLNEWGVAPFPMGYIDNDTGLEPAKGWDIKLYKKYRRLILRIPMAKSLWVDFKNEVIHHKKIPLKTISYNIYEDS